MAIKLKDTYTGRVDTNDPAYPYGKGRNIVGGVEGTGTPFEAAWYNNLEGFLQGLLVEAGVVPDGSVDTANSSQLVEAVKGLEKSANKVINDDGTTSQDTYDLIKGFDTVAEAINYNKIGKLLGTRVYIAERSAKFEIILTESAGFEPNGMDLIQSSYEGIYSLKYSHEIYTKLSLKSLGGKFDGVSSNDDFWTRLLILMQATGKSATLDSGVIRFESPNSLSSLSSIGTGFEFEGQGRFKTKFFFDYDDGYAYENTVGNGDKFPAFRNIGFYTRNVDTPNFIPESDIRAGFINLTSNGEEQGFRFDNCDIVGFNEVFRFSGTNNASETKMFGGSIKRCNDIFILDNEQSLNHELHGTDIEQYFGSLVVIESGGGNGAVKMFGGSLIPFSPSGRVSHLCKTVGTPTANLSRGPVVLNDVRAELRDENTRICNLKGTSASLSLQFKGGVIFTNANESLNTYVSIDDRKKVIFDSVDFAGNTDANLQAFNYEIVSTSQILNDPATIMFINSRIPKDTASKITFTGNSGVAMAEKCSVAERVSIPNATASDFYRIASPRGSGRGGVQPKKFFVSPFAANNAAPTLTNEIEVNLPENSRVVGMNINHDSGGASDPTYNIVMKSSDGTIEYCKTTDYNYSDGTYQEVRVLEPATVNGVKICSDSGTLTTPLFSGYIDIIYS